VDTRLLLVEDNPGDERLVREMLAETGGSSILLESVDTLSRALARLDARDIDLVLLDMSLPDSTGIDTLSKVQARAPGVPVVVLTGSRDEDLAIQAIRQGAQDYLLKGQVDARILGWRCTLHLRGGWAPTG
jgi:DNA-binding NtrC family response regulator